MHRPLLPRGQAVLLGILLVYAAVWGALSPAFTASKAGAFWTLLPVPVILFIFLLGQASRSSTYGALNEFLGRVPRRVFDDNLPLYRYVDWYRALERYADRARQAQRWDASHPQEDLLQLMRSFATGSPKPPAQRKLCVGYEEHDFFADEVFWMLRGPDGLGAEDRVVVRLRAPGWHVMARVEVACADPDKARAMLERLAEDALAGSIYRGQFLEFRYAPSPHPDADYQMDAAPLSVTFKARPYVTDADIILDELTQAILRRSVFEFFAHREELHRLGLPRKRALLLYGPPGTGKTHTCRHVHTRLGGVTSILVTGESLARLQDIGKLARQLQPALVIIEDVDLVFSAREVNPYGTVLGELMDQLDGFTPDEEVLFLLTTNAIERVEQAIRDRPGRINQCLYLGLPAPALRRRYLERYLQPYDTASVDLDHLVQQTERTSQAFLKEYVLRAVQIAAEAAGYRNGVPLALRTEHFDTAFEELTAHGNRHSQAIMGFHAESG
jgi:hypothetical protein